MRSAKPIELMRRSVGRFHVGLGAVATRSMHFREAHDYPTAVPHRYLPCPCNHVTIRLTHCDCSIGTVQ